MRSALLSLALALPLPLYAALELVPAQERRAAPGQEPAPGERKVGGDDQQGAGKEDEADIYGRPLRTKERTGTRDPLLGCWKLTEIELAGVVKGNRRAAGALLVHDEFLAFELQMAWPGNFLGTTVHQSFIAEYEFSQGRSLKVTTVVGSFLNQSAGVLDGENPGFVREYDVSVTGDRLVLSFGQSNKLGFVRQRTTGRGGRDIFGRERRESVDERDIFGRPKKPAEGSEGDERELVPEPKRGGRVPE